MSDGSWTLSNFRPITFGSFSAPSNGVASPTSAFIDGFRFLQKQLDEQVAKFHFRDLWEREFMALVRAQVKALDFKRNYGPTLLSRAT